MESKQVVLSRQIGGTRVHLTPRAQIRKSGIPSAGNGLYVCHATPSGVILAEYSGKIIAICDADDLLTLVSSNPLLCLHTHCISLIHIASAHHTHGLFSYICLVGLKGQATHVIRIGDSIWCFDSATSLEYPMEWYVQGVTVAGFANTQPTRAACNARFVTVNERVFLVSTKPIKAGGEVFAHYKRLDAAKTRKTHSARRR